MLTDEMLQSTAQKYLEKEWQNSQDSGTAVAEYCPVSWLLPELLSLVAESPQRPVSDQEPLIRRYLTERTFHDAGGDHAADDDTAAVDHQIQVLVRVLEQVRKMALAKGRWSDAPVTPQMFG